MLLIKNVREIWENIKKKTKITCNLTTNDGCCHIVCVCVCNLYSLSKSYILVALSFNFIVHNILNNCYCLDFILFLKGESQY